MKPPLFIIGTGRSGTTLLFNLLAQHPDLAWPCQAMVAGNYPTEFGLKRKPVPEPYAFWQQFYGGFASPCRDLTEDDVPLSLPGQLQSSFAVQCVVMERNQLLTKWTGWSRVRFIEKCFPGAQYIHVIRDGRAVAWSLMQQPWWRGWQGPSQWRWGPLSEGDQLAWEASGRSFAVLAGLQWKICVKNCSGMNRFVGSGIYEIHYEDLVADPQGIMSGLCKWLGLREFAWNGNLLTDRNFRWREELPVPEQAHLEAVIGSTLQKYGYL